MFKRIVAVVVGSLALIAPAKAERLHFEGTFTTYTECGFTGRHECIDPMAISVPYAFTVNVPFGVVSGRTHSGSTDRFAPPRLTPPIVMAKLALDQASFESLSDRNREVVETWFTSRIPTGIRWNFERTAKLGWLAPVPPRHP